MAHFKLILDDDLEDDFQLIAIHCSEESYKLGYLLNKQLALQLQRRNVDLEFSSDGLELTFPMFEFENDATYTSYHLVANKCKSVTARTASSGGLFGGDVQEDIVITYLLPESKNVDFFLKISSEGSFVPLKKIVNSINEVKQVISAYEIDPETLKNKNNLIFD